MRPARPSLFDDEPANAPANTTSLVASARKTRPGTKKEQAVNRLFNKVQALRNRVDEETRRLDEGLGFHVAQVVPRVQQVTALRTETVRALRPFLHEKRLAIGDRHVLRTILAGLLDEILAHDPSPPPDIRELFEELHGVSVANLVQEDFDQARSEMQELFDDLGLDIPLPELRSDMSEEELAATAAEMAERLRQAEETRAESQSARRKTKREKREEEQSQRFEQLRKISLGTVYRRLAKALHPDLERDPTLREQKGVMMQEVTGAYARNDLHTLLRLELEWLEDDGHEAARRTDETLDAYTQLLKQQAAELEVECMELRFHPRYEPLVGMDQRLGIPVMVDGPAEVQRLDGLIETMTGGLERMAAGQGLQEVQGLIEEHRRANRPRRQRY
jgi:hypothetical protein